jgi:GntR family transcriptional regulator
VRRVLTERIAAGHVRPGQRLGAERALASDLGVSRATLRQALAVLADSGVVRRVPGRGGGTFASNDKIERDTSRVVGVPALLRAWPWRWPPARDVAAGVDQGTPSGR